VRRKEVTTMQDFWDEITTLERRMDDLLRGFLGARTHLAYPALPLFVRKPFAPAMDVFKRNGNLAIRVELPGIDPEKDVRITTRDHDVVIEGERRQEEEVKQEAYYRMEATYGAFERRIPIPDGVEDEKIAATYTDGVLEVVVPIGTAELPAESRQIRVKTAKPVKAA
jgi:HSP20 family protein